ncbi:hypothetical protein Trydic_g18095 [Trypoxylus dichotomus]
MYINTTCGVILPRQFHRRLNYALNSRRARYSVIIKLMSLCTQVNQRSRRTNSCNSIPLPLPISTLFQPLHPRTASSYNRDEREDGGKEEESEDELYVRTEDKGTRREPVNVSP